MHLDIKLNFNQHFKEKISKANKVIGIVRKLNNTLLRTSLLTIYQTSVGLHLDYCDIYDQPNNKSFCNKIERAQYNAALAVTGAMTEDHQGANFIKN